MLISQKHNIPRSSIVTSFDVIDLKTGATIGPNAATPAPEIKLCYKFEIKLINYILYIYF